MDEEVTIKITKREFLFLVNRYEMSLEKDAGRDENIDEGEFALLNKLVELKK